MTQGGPFPVATPWSHHAGKRHIAVSPPVRTYGSYGCPDCYAVLAIRPGTESMPYQRWMGAVYRTVGSGNNVGHRIVLSPGNTTE